MKQRIALEAEERAAAQAAARICADEQANAAAQCIQKVRRGSQTRTRARARGARVMRHLVVQTPVGFFVSANEIEKFFLEKF